MHRPPRPLWLVSRLIVHIPRAPHSTVRRKFATFSDGLQRIIPTSPGEEHTAIQEQQNLEESSNAPKRVDSQSHDQRVRALLLEHIAETGNPVEYTRSVGETKAMSAISWEDIKETTRKLEEVQSALSEHLGRSLATSVEERLGEMNNHEDSAEATSRRRPKEYDEIVESLYHTDLHPGAPWGFVVFRTAYGPESDAPFARIIEKLRDVEEALSDEGQPYLAAHYELIVIEDEKTLAGADSHTVRDAFRAWVANDLTPRFKKPDTWGGKAEIHKMLRSDIPANDPFWDVDPHHPAITMPTRWQFCLFVDDNCLRSLDHPDLIMGPYVKILTTDWKGDRTTTTAEGWEDGETDNEHEDVGWMYMEAIDCIEMYRNLIDPSSWTDPYYSRPYKGFIP